VNPPSTGSPLPHIPGFKVLELVGRGGFSSVYRAHQPVIDRVVAIKVLNLDVTNPADQRRFERECGAAGRLTGHGNVVQLYDYGFLDGTRPYIVMEYFAGGSVADRLADGMPVSATETVAIGRRIADALDAAHMKGILHRDVKPENILIRANGDPALADFGISTTDHNRSISQLKDTFSPLHVAPETVEGREPGTSSDVYSLASTLWTMIQGRAPFERGDTTLVALAMRIIGEPVPPFETGRANEQIENTLRWALNKRPEDRPDSAAHFRDALATASETPPTARPRGDTTTLAPQRADRHSPQIGGPRHSPVSSSPASRPPATADQAGWPAWVYVLAAVLAAVAAFSGVMVVAALR